MVPIIDFIVIVLISSPHLFVFLLDLVVKDSLAIITNF